MKKPSRVWYRRCGADFIHGTMGMTLEEKGAYSLCLDLIYDHQGPIPDDARWLSGICNVSIRKWSALRERLVSLGKLHAFDGFLSNSRAEKEIEIDAERARNFAESGAKGGDKSAENRGQSNKNNEIDQASLKHSTGEVKIREVKTSKNVSSNEDTKPRDALSILSDVLDDERCKAVLEHRKSKRAKNTAYAIGLLADQLKACPDPKAAADEMILRNWTTVKPEWLERDKQRGQSPPKPSITAAAQRHEDGLKFLNDLLEGKVNVAEDPFDGNTIDLDADYGNYAAG